ncbi:SIR2-domain-containing protein [Piromyces finnis]|uniref:SIR2-domain-containing protein n=1 Tax=Piromyces finnis TaxID=1754191 RepID=A0A1Y1VCA1_9FUNG|nr:SIR2-domain-containing protein [Piromyces finnis]|eukprot:ORX52593.1 SIR2-domain-containing protein [Piromyces finnis]
METNKNYYSSLDTLNNTQKTNPIEEKINPKLRKNKNEKQSTSIKYLKRYNTINTISEYQHTPSKKNKIRNSICYTNNHNNLTTNLDCESKKEIANLISSIRKQNSYDAKASLFLPDEKENISSVKTKKSKKGKSSKKASNNNSHKTSNTANSDKSGESGKDNLKNESSSDLYNKDLQIINEDQSIFNAHHKNEIENHSQTPQKPMNLMVTKELENVDFGENSFSISNDNTLTAISSREEEESNNECYSKAITKKMDSNHECSESLKGSSVSSFTDSVETNETEETVSNESKPSSSKSILKQKKNNVINGAKKISNFRNKYLSRPIKYSMSSVFKCSVGALSSLFDLRVDDVFGIEDYNKEILKETTLKGIADYIKSNKARNIIILTGAGISTNAGIPDFRSPKTGLYSNLKKYNLPYPEAIFTLEYFKVNPEPFYHMARQFYPGYYKPTITHYFIKELQNRNLLLRNYTQNIDGLERICGIEDNKIVETHGSFNYAYCVGTKDKPSCRKTYDYKWLYSRLFPINKKFVIPRCERCNGLVKPAISFFGEPVPDRVSECAKEDFSKCDLLMVIGTSLKVEPLSRLVNEVAHNVPRLLINKTMVSAFESDKPQRRSSLSYNLDHFDIFNDPDDVEVIINRDVIALGNCDEICLKLASYLGFKNKLLQTFEKEKERLTQEVDLYSDIKKEIEEYIPSDNGSLHKDTTKDTFNPLENDNSTLTSNTTYTKEKISDGDSTSYVTTEEKLEIPSSHEKANYSDSNTEINFTQLKKKKSILRKSLPSLSKSSFLNSSEIENNIESTTGLSSHDKHISISTTTAVLEAEKRSSVSSSLVANAPSTVVYGTEKGNVKDNEQENYESASDQDNSSMIISYHELENEDDEFENDDQFKDSQDSLETSFRSENNSISDSLISVSSEESLDTISRRVSLPNKMLASTNYYHHSLNGGMNNQKSESNFDIEATMNYISNSISTTINNTQAAISTAIASSSALKDSLINEIKRNSIQTLLETKNMIINNNLTYSLTSISDNDTTATFSKEKNDVKSIENPTSEDSQFNEFKDCLPVGQDGCLEDSKTLLTLLEEEESQKSKVKDYKIKGIYTPSSEISQELVATPPKTKINNKLKMTMYLSPENSIDVENEIEEKEGDSDRFYSLPLETEVVQPSKKLKTTSLPESSSSSTYSSTSYSSYSLSSSSCSSPPLSSP